MILSVMQSLIVPKLLGVEQYGYWQLFIFYSSYIGFFHFGLNDGVYLLKGGEKRGEIDKRSVNSQFVVSVAYELLLTVCIVIMAFRGPFESDRAFVVGCAGVFLVIQNAAWFLMYLLQAMNETKLSSYSTIVNRLSFLIPLLALLFVHSGSFRPFVLAYVASAALQFAYCAWHCRDILSSGFEGWPLALQEAAGSIRVGSKLMLANIASQLVLGVLRAAIDARWGIETFGRLSLSISMVNFFLAFVSQAAMVLFPALRQSGEGEVRSFYVVARDALGLAFPAVYLLYFPMVWLMGMWLPAYAESLRYLAWLIPICVFDSKMNITCTTLFKVRREEARLLRINMATTACCAAMVTVSVFLLGSVECAVASSTLSIMGRSVVSECIVSRELGVATDDVSLWEVGLTLAFVVLALLAPELMAVAGYAAMYVVFLTLHRVQLMSVLRAVRG